MVQQLTTVAYCCKNCGRLRESGGDCDFDRVLHRRYELASAFYETIILTNQPRVNCGSLCRQRGDFRRWWRVISGIFLHPLANAR